MHIGKHPATPSKGLRRTVTEASPHDSKGHTVVYRHVKYIFIK